MFKTSLRDSSGFAIRLMWVAVILFPSLWLLVSALHQSKAISSADAPAWVQAVGSILAIVYAVNISNSQHKRAQDLRKEEALAQFQRLAGFFGYVIGGMSATVEHLESASPDLANAQRHIELLEESSAVLKGIGLDGIRNIELSSSWIKLRFVLSDFIGVAKKGATIDDLKNNYLPHMKRSLERAESCQSEVLELEESVLHSGPVSGAL